MRPAPEPAAEIMQRRHILQRITGYQSLVLARYRRWRSIPWSDRSAWWILRFSIVEAVFIAACLLLLDVIFDDEVSIWRALAFTVVMAAVLFCILMWSRAHPSTKRPLSTKYPDDFR
jgi:hypothetical protein